MALKFGDEFVSLQAVEEAIAKFEDQQKISYWRRDTRTLQAAQKRINLINPNQDLVYYEMKYACIK